MKTFTIYMEGTTYGCKQYEISTEISKENAIEVYEQTEKLANRVGKTCWLVDNDTDEIIRHNY